MAVWFDIEDLLLYFRYAPRPTGIQRLSFEILREAATHPGVAFCRRDGDGFSSIDFAAVAARVDAAAAAPQAEGGGRAMAAREKLSGFGRALPLHYRMPAGEIWRGAKQIFSGMKNLAQAGAEQATGAARRQARIGGGKLALDGAPVVFAPGDWLVNLGASWNTPYPPGLPARLHDAGAKFALLIHDLIPALFPEWTPRGTAQLYETWLTGIVPAADLLFANSRATAADLSSCLAKRGCTVPPVTVLPPGGSPPMPATAVAGPEKYVLMVGTIEVRKNHILAFRLWRRLLRDLPRDAVPDLVIAGKPGWLTEDLMRQLDNADWLGGKIRLASAPSEPELAALYHGCRFTLFPSFYEGWGLPVTESLSHGKTVAAARNSAIPEAGGDFCAYFDPDNFENAYEVVSGLIRDPARVSKFEAKIASEFRPPLWRDTAGALVEEIAAF